MSATIPRWIPLKLWAKREYGDKPPCRATLLKWVHDGRIQPAPEKHGKAWQVRPTAEYKAD
jgi:hypothetical protein